jgi:hypothetical protein
MSERLSQLQQKKPSTPGIEDFVVSLLETSLYRTRVVIKDVVLQSPYNFVRTFAALTIS